MGKIIFNNQTRKGFTVIEVVLFVAISGLLLVGLLFGVTSSIARQRYQDSVQDLADFLKTQFYAVSNPQLPEWFDGRWMGQDMLDYNTGDTCGFAEPIVGLDYEGNATAVPRRRGQSNCQYYGRLITFGENGEQDRVNVYLVVGMDGRGGALSGVPLDDLIASDIFIPAPDMADNYYIPFSAQAQSVGVNAPLRAAILIARPPRSGGVRTFIATQPFGENYDLTQSWRILKDGSGDPSEIFPDTAFTGTNAFRLTGELNICVGSDDIYAIGGVRREIRIKAGGGNASAVEIMAVGDGACEV
jgi:hypothetical protein